MEKPELPPKSTSATESDKLHGYLMQVYDKSLPNGEKYKEERWCILSHKNTKLYVYQSKQDLHPMCEINILKTAFFYDPENEKVFILKSGKSSVIFEADSVEICSRWLKNLQEARECGYYQVGKWKTYDKAVETSIRSPKWIHNSFSVPRRPKSLEFFDNLAQNFNKMRPSVAVAVSGMKAVTSALGSGHKVLEASKSNGSDGNSSVTRKLRSSFRLKNNIDIQGVNTYRKQPTLGFDAKELAKTLETVTDDLNNAKEELKASRQVIQILQYQIQALTQEKDTLTLMHRLELHDTEILDILREKDNSIVELENKLQESQLLAEKLQTFNDELSEKKSSLEDNVSAYEELIQGKNATILKLSSELGESSIISKLGATAPYESVYPENEMSEKLASYINYVKFLENEVMKLNDLFDQSVKKEMEKSIEVKDWEAKFYQIQSKYLLLLNDLHSPSNENKDNVTMVSQLFQDLIENSQEDLNIKSLKETENYDELGFQKSKFCLKRSSIANKKSEGLHSYQPRWESILANWENFDSQNSSDLKAHMRCGVPNEHRGKVWSLLVRAGIQKHQSSMMKDVTSGYYNSMLATVKSGNKTNPAAKQIELDLLRTLPGNKHYDSSHSDGIPKLRRVLLSFSQFFPEIGYCQGINRIAAIALLFMNEEDAFWCLVYIVGMILPRDYYNEGLIGAQVDQRVLKDLISEKLPRLYSHIESHSVDLTLFTFNWLLCLFVDSLPVKVYLRVWDSFLYEGSKVLFRYALAVFKYLEGDIMDLTDHMMIFNFLHTAPKTILDADRLSQIAFGEVGSFPMKHIKHKRENYLPVVKAEYDEMEANRRTYSKRITAVSNVSLSDED